MRQTVDCYSFDFVGNLEIGHVCNDIVISSDPEACNAQWISADSLSLEVPKPLADISLSCAQMYKLIFSFVSLSAK
jgi:hypothetical protein